MELDVEVQVTMICNVEMKLKVEDEVVDDKIEDDVRMDGKIDDEYISVKVISLMMIHASCSTTISVTYNLPKSFQLP